jgi:hypothetical protein
MKPNAKLLKAELDKSKKLMEDIAIKNSSELNGNWSAAYHTRKEQGLSPYLKIGYLYKLSTGRGKNIVYMTPEQADELNKLGEQIQALTKQYNEKIQQYVKD